VFGNGSGVSALANELLDYELLREIYGYLLRIKIAPDQLFGAAVSGK